MLCGGALEARAQAVVAERAAGEDDDGNAVREQGLRALAHGVVRGGLDHHFGAGRDQFFYSDDEGRAELARERLAAGVFAAAGYRHHLRLAHFAAPRVLEEEPRDDPAAQDADAHVSRAALFS